VPQDSPGGAATGDQRALDGGAVPVVAGNEQAVPEGDGIAHVQRGLHRRAVATACTVSSSQESVAVA